MHKFIYIQNYYSNCVYIYRYCSFANDFLILFFSHFVANLLPWFSLSLFKVLNLKGNSLSGQIPDLIDLLKIKSLFLNNFSRNFLDSISNLHHLKIVNLAENQISGQIPTSLLKLQRLYTLYLQDNNLTGSLCLIEEEEEEDLDMICVILLGSL